MCRHSTLPEAAEDTLVYRQLELAFDLSIGRLKLKVTPRDTLRTAPIRPACASTIDLQIAKPMPMPVFFVVKNGSKIFSKFTCPAP